MDKAKTHPRDSPDKHVHHDDGHDTEKVENRVTDEYNHDAGRVTGHLA